MRVIKREEGPPEYIWIQSSDDDPKWAVVDEQERTILALFGRRMHAQMFLDRSNVDVWIVVQVDVS